MVQRAAHNLRLQFIRARNAAVKIIHLKPQQQSIARLDIRIPNRPVIMLHVPELQDEPTLRNQSLVFLSAMVALTTQ